MNINVSIINLLYLSFLLWLATATLFGLELRDSLFELLSELVSFFLLFLFDLQPDVREGVSELTQFDDYRLVDIFLVNDFVFLLRVLKLLLIKNVFIFLAEFLLLQF